MYKRIMVPLDGSSVAEIVLPYAEEMASKFGAESRDSSGERL
jgi:nucleotide-binding universal stress UspA family protein